MYDLIATNLPVTKLELEVLIWWYLTDIKSQAS